VRDKRRQPSRSWDYISLIVLLMLFLLLLCTACSSKTELILYIDGEAVDRIEGVSCENGGQWEFSGVNFSPGQKIEVVGTNNGNEVCRRELGNPKNLTTGDEPPYKPEEWNDGDVVQYSNNCYSYAVSNRDPADHQWCRPQPGAKSGSPVTSPQDVQCSIVENAALSDGLTRSDCGNACGSGQYKVALVIDPGKDYHWYRQDESGYWSHKPGTTEATDLDASGNRISDPRFANRDYYPRGANYSEFCGCFCVPKEGIQTRCR